MTTFRIALLILISALATPAFAYTPKEGNVTATFGPYIYRTNFKGANVGAPSPLFGTLGLIANGDIDDKGSLEIALFHMNKLYLREQRGRFITEQAELIHITMGYRRWISPLYSWSVALYSAYSIGDPKEVHSDFAPGAGIVTSASDLTEYGFDLSMQAELWAQGRQSVVLDGRYAWSFTSKESERGDHYGVFLGYKYLIQEKQHNRERPE